MTFVPCGLKSDSSTDFCLWFGLFPSLVCEGKKDPKHQTKGQKMKTQTSTMKKAVLKILEKRNQLETF